jgi:hypothetical protein
MISLEGGCADIRRRMDKGSIPTLIRGLKPAKMRPIPHDDLS